MDYHYFHYFTDVKISDVAAGSPGVSYIIALKNMLHKNLQTMQKFPILNKWVGYFDSSL